MLRGESPARPVFVPYAQRRLYTNSTNTGWMPKTVHDVWLACFNINALDKKRNMQLFAILPYRIGGPDG
jgi:hypothetical protein